MEKPPSLNSLDEDEDLSEGTKNNPYLSLINETNFPDSPKLKNKNKRNKAKKRIDVYGVQDEEDIIHENIQINKDKTPTAEDIDTILKTLSNHFFFNNCSTEELQQMIEKMFYASTNKDEYIFKQNDRGSCFFFIAKGTVEIIIDLQKKKTLTVNESFGELALLYDSPRSASI